MMPTGTRISLQLMPRQEFQKVVGEQRTTQVLLKEAMASLKSVYAKEVGFENQVFHLQPVQPFSWEAAFLQESTSKVAGAHGEEPEFKAWKIRGRQDELRDQASLASVPTVGRTSSSSLAAMAQQAHVRGRVNKHLCFYAAAKHVADLFQRVSGAWHAAAVDRGLEGDGS